MSFTSELRRRFLFEGWSISEPENDARRRAAWPRWRHFVRPVCALALFTMGVLSAVTGAPGAKVFGADHGAFTALIVIAASCIVFGVWDGVRWRRAERTRLRA